MKNGKCTIEEKPTLDTMADLSTGQLERLPQGCRRFINPHRYKVSISEGLKDLRNSLMEKVTGGQENA